MKVLKSDARNKIGTLKRADDSFTMTAQETILETHFLDSKEVDNCPEEGGAIRPGTLQDEQGEFEPAPTNS